MSRLVVVSNRVPDPAKNLQAGGVSVAIGDCLKSRQGLWFGWSGTCDEASNSGLLVDIDIGSVARATLPLTEAEYDSYYLGYSNSVLWPVFHNRVDLAQFEAGYFNGK